MGSPADSGIKNLPEMQETWVQSLDWEDPLEKEMATHSSILGLENPKDRGIWKAMRLQRSDMPEQLSTHAHIYNLLFAIKTLLRE